MSIKACHITSVHKRYDTRIFHKECTSLAKAGYDVTLLVADNKATEMRNGVRIISVDFKPKSRLDRILHSCNTMLKFAVQIDAEIYHFHDPELLPLAKKLKRLGKKVIFDSHENYPTQISHKHYLPGITGKAVSFLYKIYETHALKYCDAVIIPCTFFNGVNIFEGRCKRTVYISNVPKLEELYNNYSPNIKRSNRTICHVGSLTHDRGITHLIKAAYSSNVRLILAGNFSPAGYHETLKKMPEYRCVDYRGFVDRKGLLEIFNEASIGMATILNIGQYNTGDNLATKVYEYMSVGLPVIVSKYVYVDKLLKKYRFGISVDPSDVGAIADGIHQLIENNVTADAMGTEGRRAIREQFNWEQEKEKLIALYKAL